MKPYYQDTHVTIHNGSCLNMDIPDESIQCVVTSPPYWGLRKYSGEQELVWGDNHCEHEWDTSSRILGTGGLNEKQMSNRGQTGQGYSSSESTCQLCGAWRGSFGLEPTPEMYVAHTVEILREIKQTD